MHRNSAYDFNRDELLDAFDSAGVALGVLDATGRLLSVNHTWSVDEPDRHVPTVLRIAPYHSCVEHVQQAARTGDEFAARLAAELGRLLERQVRRFRCEYFEPTEQRWFEITVNALSHRSGAVISSTDITTRKRAIAATATQIDELARNTRAATISSLAVAAGHELQQPIAAIMANADAALQYLRGRNVHGQLHEIVVGIAASANRATDIISRMRRLLSGEMPERRELDLNGLVTDVVSLLGEDALQRQLRIEAILDVSQPVVLGDAVQLQQVMINLLVNAMDVSANAVAGDRTVQIITQQHGNTAEICVTDHGPPLDPAALKRIFEPFYTTKRTGMGLGLYITRAIVESHGGSIAPRPNGDHGLNMLVKLPTLITESESFSPTVAAMKV